MLRETSNNEDTAVRTAGGDGDGRRTQEARRGKCGRQLPTTGGAGRDPDKRPALVARGLISTVTIVPRVRAPASTACRLRERLCATLGGPVYWYLACLCIFTFISPMVLQEDIAGDARTSS